MKKGESGRERESLAKGPQGVKTGRKVLLPLSSPSRHGRHFPPAVASPPSTTTLHFLRQPQIFFSSSSRERRESDGDTEGRKAGSDRYARNERREPRLVVAPPPTGGVTDTGGDAQGAQTAKAEVKRLFSLPLRPDEQTDGKAFQGGEEKGALGGGKFGIPQQPVSIKGKGRRG